MRFYEAQNFILDHQKFSCKTTHYPYNTGQPADSLTKLTKPPGEAAVLTNFHPAEDLTMAKLLEEVRDQMRTRHYSYRFFFNDPPSTEIYTLSLHDRSSDQAAR